MAVSESSRERAVLENLRERYEGEGYEFFPYPPSDLLPPFLEDYRPDAIAVGPTGRVAIEVKQNRRQANSARLSRVASLFSSHPDWRFVVVYSDDNARAERSLSRPSRRDLERELSTVETLVRQGQSRAAIVLAWAALEAAARLLLSAPEATSPPRSPRQVLEELEREGFLDRETSKSLWEEVPLRNAIVHGDLATEIESSAIDQLLTATRQLLGNLTALPQANA